MLYSFASLPSPLSLLEDLILVSLWCFPLFWDYTTAEIFFNKNDNFKSASVTPSLNGLLWAVYTCLLHPKWFVKYTLEGLLLSLREHLCQVSCLHALRSLLKDNNMYLNRRMNSRLVLGILISWKIFSLKSIFPKILVRPSFDRCFCDLKWTQLVHYKRTAHFWS